MPSPTPALLHLLRHYEGLRLEPYYCPGGYYTIGYGHVLSKQQARNTGSITHEQAELWLAQDAADAQASVTRLIPRPLAPYEHDALTSFTFNLGAGALQRSTLRQHVLRQEHHSAAEQFLRWIYAGGRPLKGLIKRRHTERALFLWGDYTYT